MAAQKINYNERAWAIDVISEINRIAQSNNLQIKRAGGEYTLSLEKGSMFPDVVLFGDDDGTVVLQGWELKMPDTAVTDVELISNAEKKARRLNLNSFVLWNAREAVLYALDDETNSFRALNNWTIADIVNRGDVALHERHWKLVLAQIIEAIDNFLVSGEIRATNPDLVIGDQIYLDFLSQYLSPTAELLKRSCNANADLEFEVHEWFEEYKHEYKTSDQFKALAHVNIVGWINRILFAHYLKVFNQKAEIIDNLNRDMSLEDGIKLINKITENCDFMNVFKSSIGHDLLPRDLWLGLAELNQLLVSLRFKEIKQKSFHRIIDSALSFSRRKLAGQFSTPEALARYLVEITMRDRQGHTIDPCCGTGTIAKSTYNLKRDKGLSVPDALSTTWASDKFSSPLQLCSIALSDPNGMGEIVQVFRQDALSLAPNQVVKFTDPFNGKVINRTTPRFSTVVSNLPFVRFEQVAKLNDVVNEVREELVGRYETTPSKKSDLYALLALKLKDIVTDDGRLGFILSNSWLGATWGDEFKKSLFEAYRVVRVVVSGNGRWFSNAEVVTSIIVLEPRTDDEHNIASEKVQFVTTLLPVSDWTASNLQKLISSTVLGKSQLGCVRVESHTIAQIKATEKLGVGWYAFFTDIDWLSTISSKLVPVSNYFAVARGERRGWDELFYPEQGHGIEHQYIKPVLKNSREATGSLTIKAKSDAFCCSLSEDELKRVGSTGALSWIDKFRYAKNGVGKPLPDVLGRAGHYWYEMKAETLADMTISINPDKRLCVYRLDEPAFVNQRLISLTAKKSLKDAKIAHAVLNSAISMFLIEAVGFGRGLGALDLNATNIKRRLHMLDPALLSEDNAKKVMQAFSSVASRNPKDLPEELMSEDRIAFDEALIDAFDLGISREAVYGALLDLYNIRQTARN